MKSQNDWHKERVAFTLGGLPLSGGFLAYANGQGAVFVCPTCDKVHVRFGDQKLDLSQEALPGFLALLRQVDAPALVPEPN